MQLRTLLASIGQHWGGVEHRVSVLYNTSAAEFQRGYDRLAADYPHVRFVREGAPRGCHGAALLRPFNLVRYAKYRCLRRPKSDFREQLIAMLHASAAPFVMFLTDDSQFVAPVRLSADCLRRVAADPMQVQYSLRLGQRINAPGAVERLGDDCLAWRMDDPRNQRDWRYRFSVDAHIYDRRAVLRLARRVLFCNPNTYEAFTAVYCRRAGLLSRGLCHADPCILSFPINMVQDVQDNESLAVRVDDLQRLDDEGWRLSYPLPTVVETFQHYPQTLTLRRGGEEKTIQTCSR